MPRSFKLKIIIGGSSGSGKTSFLNGKPSVESDFNQLGVSFKPIECIIDNGDSYKFILWDLKVSNKFGFLYPALCRGASGAFLCVDMSSYKSFEEIPLWINIFKNCNRLPDVNFPIILIGTKMDFPNREVTEDQVYELAEKYELDGVFFTSIHDNNKKQIKTTIFKKLIENVEPFYHIQDCSIFMPREDEYFINFMNYFITCPICKNKNHFESLKSFYYSRDPNITELKDQLISLVELLEDYDYRIHNRVNIGIPCCNCYKEIFEK